MARRVWADGERYQRHAGGDDLAVRHQNTDPTLFRFRQQTGFESAGAPS